MGCGDSGSLTAEGGEGAQERRAADRKLVSSQPDVESGTPLHTFETFLWGEHHGPRPSLCVQLIFSFH